LFVLRQTSTQNPRKNSNTANILNNFNGQLPIPIRLSESTEHYPTLADLLDDNILLNDFCEKNGETNSRGQERRKIMSKVWLALCFENRL